jgi:hypothetical protein
MSPSRRTPLALAIAAAVASCGRLASGDFQPPPVATVRGRLTLPADTPASAGRPVRVLLVWQSAEWTPDPGEGWWQANPLTSTTGTAPGADALSCARPNVNCELSQSQACTVRYGLAEQVATLTSPGPQGSVEFEAPIYALPPAAARRTLSSRAATLAIGYLVFLVELPGAGGVETVLASSAFSGASVEHFPTGDFTSPYRTSSYLTFLDRVRPGPLLAGTNPGVLDRIEPGFGLVLKLEKVDPQGRLLPVGLSQVPIDTQVGVDGQAASERGAWCDAVAIAQTWEPRPGAIRNGEGCRTTAEAFSCDVVSQAELDPCRLSLRRYQFDAACAQPPAIGGCPPDTFTADAVGPATPVLGFQPLLSGSVLALGAAAANELKAVNAWLYQPSAPDWWPARPLSFPRAASTVTLLPSGEVLVIGGSLGDDESRTAERFTPATGTWVRTSSMVTPRTGHTATLLPGGEVLVLGGWRDASRGGSWGGELYDPAQGTWRPFAPGIDGPPLIHHAAVLLDGTDGPVLVTGPEGGPAAFICRRLSGCQPTGTMIGAHPGGTFTRLRSGPRAGSVLALGGDGDPTSAELFDPLLETWTPLRPMPRGRTQHAALELPSGEVLVAGGEPDGVTASPLGTADRYDPASDLWTAIPGSLVRARSGLTLAPSAAGQVLVLGGHDASGGSLPLERYCGAPATP